MLDWLYPMVCTLCGNKSDTGTSLCSTCREGALQRVPRPLCLYCGAPVSSRHTVPDRCAECDKRPRSFTFARAALVDDEVSFSLIHRLKYAGASHLAPALAPFLAELWEQTALLREHTDWCLIPVPVERGRLFNRGFNQAEELARALMKLRPKLRLINALQRLSRGSATQTRLSASARLRNAHEVFHVRPEFASGRRTVPPHLIVIDDVYTTGATARACARALKKLPGVRKVAVLTLLRVT